MNQDFVAWVGQGRIADRTKEVLSGGDVGISMIRNRFFSEIDLIRSGADPKGTIRDPEAARCVDLPCQQKQLLIDGIDLGEYQKYPLLNQRLSGFRHLYGQPPEVRKAFVDAFGLEG
jgi:5,5'-dehydrodivanillate O-demethylase